MSTKSNILAMVSLIALASTTNLNCFEDVVDKPIRKDESYKRSKCKSCKEWSNVTRCPIKQYRHPLQQACELYKQK
jgi:hypothetical protein